MSFSSQYFRATPYSFIRYVFWSLWMTSMGWLSRTTASKFKITRRLLLVPFRRCSLVSISNSLTCFRKFSISWSCSLWYEETNLSPCEEASSESTLVSCPSCMWSSSLFCSLSNLLWPYDETLEWLPLEPIDPSLACGPSILGGDRLALCLQLSKRFLQMAVIVVPGLIY